MSGSAHGYSGETADAHRAAPVSGDGAGYGHSADFASGVHQRASQLASWIGGHVLSSRTNRRADQLLSWSPSGPRLEPERWTRLVLSPVQDLAARILNRFRWLARPGDRVLFTWVRPPGRFLRRHRFPPLDEGGDDGRGPGFIDVSDEEALATGEQPLHDTEQWAGSIDASAPAGDAARGYVPGPEDAAPGEASGNSLVPRQGQAGLAGLLQTIRTMSRRRLASAPGPDIQGFGTSIRPPAELLLSHPERGEAPSMLAGAPREAVNAENGPTSLPAELVSGPGKTARTARSPAAESGRRTLRAFVSRLTSHSTGRPGPAAEADISTLGESIAGSDVGDTPGRHDSVPGAEWLPAGTLLFARRMAARRLSPIDTTGPVDTLPAIPYLPGETEPSPTTNAPGRQHQAVPPGTPRVPGQIAFSGDGRRQLLTGMIGQPDLPDAVESGNEVSEGRRASDGSARTAFVMYQPQTPDNLKAGRTSSKTGHASSPGRLDGTATPEEAPPGGAHLLARRSSAAAGAADVMSSARLPARRGPAARAGDTVSGAERWARVFTTHLPLAQDRPWSSTGSLFRVPEMPESAGPGFAPGADDQYASGDQEWPAQRTPSLWAERADRAWTVPGMPFGVSRPGPLAYSAQPRGPLAAQDSRSVARAIEEHLDLPLHAGPRRHDSAEASGAIATARLDRPAAAGAGAPGDAAAGHSERAPEGPGGVDLDSLARDVYQIIMRRLATERERCVISR